MILIKPGVLLNCTYITWTSTDVTNKLCHKIKQIPNISVTYCVCITLVRLPYQPEPIFTSHKSYL